MNQSCKSLQNQFPARKKLRTYSPSEETSDSGGSLRTKVTVAPVCLGLISTVIFHAGPSAAVALSSRKPLLTRPLQQQNHLFIPHNAVWNCNWTSTTKLLQAVEVLHRPFPVSALVDFICEVCVSRIMRYISLFCWKSSGMFIKLQKNAFALELRLKL